MNKKLILISIFFIVLAAGFIVLINIRNSKGSEDEINKNNSQNTELNIAANIMPSNNLKEYSDSSGFNFNFPDNLKVDKKENEDLYADLALTSGEASGNIIITVSDSKYDSLDTWKNGNSKELTGLLVKESKLGKMTGISFNNHDKTTLIAIDQGIEFKMVVDYKDQKKYWESVLDNITNSFSFATPNTQPASNTDSSSSSEDVVFEGEEVVE